MAIETEIMGMTSLTDLSFVLLDLTIFGIPLIFILVAVLLLKGFAMWKAARLNEKVWFWILLIFNTAGILPAIYLYIRRMRKV